MIPIAPNQLDDFKEHAKRLAEAINELEPERRKLYGRLARDHLAVACGYSNGYRHLVFACKGQIDNPEPLRIFEGEEGRELGRVYAMVSGIHPGRVAAAVTLAGTWLYLFNKGVE